MLLPGYLGLMFLRINCLREIRGAFTELQRIEVSGSSQIVIVMPYVSGS
jgi:hypothetical protein